MHLDILRGKHIVFIISTIELFVEQHASVGQQDFFSEFSKMLYFYVLYWERHVPKRPVFKKKSSK